MTTFDQPVRPAPPKQLRIGLWGPPGSGKTTFLAALYIAIGRNNGPDNWIMNGADDAATTFLHRSVDQLTNSKTFPSATWDATGMVFRFTGEKKFMRRNRMMRWVQDTERVAFELDVLDVPGSIFKPTVSAQPDRPDRSDRSDRDDDGFRADGISTSPSSGYAEPTMDQDERLLDHLQMCQGIIYLFDPERDAREGDAYQYFYPILERLTRRVFEQDDYPGVRLPHHIAVCVTKFDQPDIYKKARLRGYVVQEDQRPYLPRVEPERAQDFFRSLCDDPHSNTDLVERGLRSHFDTIEYFVTSSIGFYVTDRRFRPHDCMNVERTGPGPNDFRIKGKIFPINVLEPLLWLQQSLRSAG